MENFDIKESTELFWNEFVTGNFSKLDNFLSPDCRLQDQFGIGVGSNDHSKVMAKLKEIQQKLVGAKLDTTMKNIQVMRNTIQIRYMVSGSYGFIKIVLGFAVEWHQGIITNLVIIKGASDSTFYVDDTEAPVVTAPAAPISSAVEEPVAHQTSATSTISNSTEAAISQQHIEPSPTVFTPASSTTSAAKPSKWYPGKLLTRAVSKETPTAAISQLAISEPLAPYDTLYPMGKSLTTPYIVPKPPLILPTLRITIIKCTNLVSRLKTLIPRPINCYVEVTVHNRTRSTPVVSRSADPVFDATNGNNQFMFEIPNTLSFNVTNGFIWIRIKDKHPVVAEDILAEVKIPLVSLKCCYDSTLNSANDLCLPLQLLERRTIGRGFLLATDVESDPATAADLSCLYINVCKMDIYQWWILEELRARDEQREQERLKQLAEKQKQSSASSQSKTKAKPKSSAPPPAPTPVAPKEVPVVCKDAELTAKTHWVDDKDIICCPE